MFGCCGTHGLFGFGSLGSVGWILNLAFAGLVFVVFVGLVIWMVRKFSGNSGAFIRQSPFSSEETSPTAILGKRYVRGEITREQYKQMLKDLKEM